MKIFLPALLIGLSLGGGAFAAGDSEAGAKEFNKCKTCHMLAAPDGTEVVKGGKTGPNLYGVIGRPAGSADFRYSASMKAAGEAGLIWDETLLAEYVTDPTAFLRKRLDDPAARSTMAFKLRKGSEDIAAFLTAAAPAATPAPAAPQD